MAVYYFQKKNPLLCKLLPEEESSPLQVIRGRGHITLVEYYFQNSKPLLCKLAIREPYSATRRCPGTLCGARRSKAFLRRIRAEGLRESSDVVMFDGAVNRQPGYRARNLQSRGFALKNVILSDVFLRGTISLVRILALTKTMK